MNNGVHVTQAAYFKFGRMLYLLLALLTSLLLHLLLVYGLNVYSTSAAPSATATRLTLRIVSRPPPLPIAPSAAAVLQDQLGADSVLTLATSRVKIPIKTVRSVVTATNVVATPLATPSATPEPAAVLPAPPIPNMPTMDLLEVPDLRYLPASEVDVAAKPAEPISPNFPLRLQHADAKGMVVLLLKIDETGLVVDGEIEFAEPPGMFDQAALGPFMFARYVPAQKNGRPVRSQKRIEVIFGDYVRPLLGPPSPS